VNGRIDKAEEAIIPTIDGFGTLREDDCRLDGGFATTIQTGVHYEPGLSGLRDREVLVPEGIAPLVKVI